MTFDQLIARQAEYDTKDDNFTRTKRLVQIKEILNLLEGSEEAFVQFNTRRLREMLASYLS